MGRNEMRAHGGLLAILPGLLLLPTSAPRAADRLLVLGPLATWTSGHSLGIGAQAQCSLPGWLRGLDLSASWVDSFPRNSLAMGLTHWELDGRLTQRIGLKRRRTSLYAGLGVVLIRETARVDFLGRWLTAHDRFTAPRLVGGIRVRVPPATLFLDGRLTAEPPGGIATNWQLRPSVGLGLLL
jgi:hypothetical protein